MIRTLVHRTRSRLRLPWRPTNPPFVGGIREAYERGWRGCPCVFVLSTGRTGTETLATLLGASSDVTAHHEPLPRLLWASGQAFTRAESLSRGTHWRDVVLGARDDLVVQAHRQGKIYFEANNRLTLLAGALKEAFPESKFILLHRHPYEVIRSGLRRGYYGSHPWDPFRPRPPESAPNGPRWDQLDRAVKIAWYWAAINEQALRFLGTLPCADVFVLQSAELFGGVKTTIEALFEFVGARCPSERKVKRILSRRLNAQRRGVAGPTWEPSQRRAIHEMLEPTASLLGYQLTRERH